MLLIALGSQASESLKVLGIFPHPALSHFRSFQPLLLELANRGHEVFVVSHFAELNAPKNYNDFALSNLSETPTLPVEDVRLNIIS